MRGDYGTAIIPYSNDPLWVVLCDESISLRSAPDTTVKVITQIPLCGEVEFVDTAINGAYSK